MSVRNGVTVRGVSNGNERGSAETRRRRKVWLLETYRANRDLIFILQGDPRPDSVRWETSEVYLITPEGLWTDVPLGDGEMACRCYRCGVLLALCTLTVDRIIQGCKGGTYRRNNIRPACSGCNSETGGALAKAKIKKVKGRRGHRVLEAAT